MNSEPTTLLQGTLDLLILGALIAGEMHGLGISRRVQQITIGTFIVKLGSLFPALHRMEEEGWISSFWGESETNRRAKYYRLTKARRKQLQIETKRWSRIYCLMKDRFVGVLFFAASWHRSCQRSLLLPSNM